MLDEFIQLPLNVTAVNGRIGRSFGFHLSNLYLMQRSRLRPIFHLRVRNFS